MRALVFCTNERNRNFVKLTLERYPSLCIDETDDIVNFETKLYNYHVIFVDTLAGESIFNAPLAGNLLYQFVCDFGGTLIVAQYTNFENDAQSLQGSFPSIHPLNYSTVLLPPSFKVKMNKLVKPEHPLLYRFRRFARNYTRHTTECTAKADTQVIATIAHVPLIAIRNAGNRNGCVIALNTTLTSLGIRRASNKGILCDLSQLIRNCVQYHKIRQYKWNVKSVGTAFTDVTFC